MTAYRWAQKDIYNSSSATASNAAIAWASIPFGADNVAVVVDSSGTWSAASQALTVVTGTEKSGSLRSTGSGGAAAVTQGLVAGQRLFTLVASSNQSSTYHTVLSDGRTSLTAGTTPVTPRFIGVVRSGTAEGRILVRAYFRERAY